MITVNLTYTGRPLPNGLHRVNLYVTYENDEQFDLSPRAEQRAIEDAKLIVRDIVKVNDPDDEDRLLQRGEPSPDDSIVCRAKISLRWDRKRKMVTYHRAGYERFLWESKWQPVAALMMEQYDYTFGVLRKRENAERKQKDKKKNYEED
jgi:hypothetical protein